MRKGLVLVWILATTIAAQAQSSYASAPEKTDAVFSALRTEWGKNLREKRVEASVAAYVPEAEFTQPDGSLVHGTDALRGLFAKVTASYDSRILFFLSKVQESGETATDTGQFRELLTTRADGKRTMISGGYVTEYRRAAGGKWLIAKQKWTLWGTPIALDLAAHPVIALTFDDLPAAGSLPAGMTRTGIAQQITTELKAAQMEGTYGFVNGVKMENSSDAQQALRVWLDAGMDIGSHTWSHPSLSEISAEAYIADIAHNEPTLAQWGKSRDWKWLRYPFLYEGNTLEKRHAVRNWLKDHGYRVAQVTLDFEDYAWNNAYGRCLVKKDDAAIQWLHDSYLSNAAEYIQLGREEQIIAFGHEIPNVLLMHETAFTTHMLPELIAQLRAQGFSFQSLAHVESDPAYALDPDAALEYGGTLPDQFMDAKKLPYPPFDPKPFDRLNKICK